MDEELLQHFMNLNTAADHDELVNQLRQLLGDPVGETEANVFL